MTPSAVPIQKKALVAGCSRHEGEDQSTNHEEGATIMSSVTEATMDSNPTATSCAHAWCDVNHVEAPGLHIREWVRGRVRLDFVLEEKTGETSISWVDVLDLSFTSDQLEGVDEIAAALIAGRAEFEVFAAEVTR